MGVNLCSLRARGGGGAQLGEIGQQQIRAGHALQRERGVEQIGRRQPAMNEPARSADVDGDFLEERDDVVVGALLVLAHFFDIERGLGADDLRVLGRDDADLRHAFAGEHFNFEPVVELGFFAPKRGHLGPGITGDHRATMLEVPRPKGKGKFRTEG